MVKSILSVFLYNHHYFRKWKVCFSYCMTQPENRLKILASWWSHLNRTSPRETFHCYTPSTVPAGRTLWQSWSYCILSAHRKFQQSPKDSRHLHIQDEMTRSADRCTGLKEPQLTRYNTCCLGSSLGGLGWQSYRWADSSGSNKTLLAKKIGRASCRERV